MHLSSSRHQSPLRHASFLSPSQWSHQPSIKRRPANGDVICAAVACGGGENELIALMNYICIIDKLYFCLASINIYLYNLSLCLIVTGWPVSSSFWQGGWPRSGAKCVYMQVCRLHYQGRDCVCMQTKNLVIGRVHFYPE